MAKVTPGNRILIIVESPNKKKTLSQFLDSNYVVMPSVGHIARIANCGEYNMGINVSDGSFSETYEIADDKKEVVAKLKEQVKFADKVVLASDPDREGEAIAWFLRKLKKKKKGQYERVTYHEVTKKAVEEALKHPRDIDENYVLAQQVRADWDKIVGFPGSQASRANGKGNSIGNVQSAALAIIVIREEEIEKFVVEVYFDLYLNFSKNNVPFKAKYVTDKRLKSLEECKVIADACKGNDYVITDITKKDSKENPKPPFMTSSFLQEVTSKLNLTAEQATKCAQQLFEGIELNGQHVALITYPRTDDTTLDKDFVTELKQFITNTYGKEYCGEVKVGKKSENAQEGHEGIRVIDLSITPETVKQYVNNDLLCKVYSIIYKRTVACCMKPAIIANTIYTIKNGEHEFSMNSKELRFDGYRRAYSYKDDDSDDDSQVIKETFKKNEILQNTELEGIEKHTNPPARYTEATFLKELDKLGIGRPSTFSSTLATLKDDKRGYAKVVGKELVPTQSGIELVVWLRQFFPELVDLKNRAKQEEELDLIASGKKTKLEVLTQRWTKFKAQLDKVTPGGNQEKLCPNCGRKMVVRRGHYGPFWACSGYPECKTSESMKKKSS